MTRRTCPSEAELGRAFSSGDGRLAAHAGSCAPCAAVLDELASLVALGRQLPAGDCSPAEREEVRTSLLALAAQEPRGGAQPPARGRWVRLGALASVAAAAAVAAWTGSQPNDPAPVAVRPPVVAPPPPLLPAEPRVRGSIHASGAVVFLRTSTQPDEVVHLVQGRLDIDVAPLGPGERFRVITKDAEVEVRGTSFVVEARDDRLVHVSVAHGHVDVRREHEPAAVLLANDAWDRGEPAAGVTAGPRADIPVRRPPPPVARPEPRPPAEPPPPAAAPPRPETPPLPRSAAEAAFARAWDLLRKQEFSAAAEAFSGAIDPAASPVAEDASFWRAVALTRAGRRAEARAAWLELLAGFPRSVRRGEAQVALGWLALEAGSVDDAMTRFSDAEHDPVPRVASAARAGVQAALQRGAHLPGSSSRKPDAGPDKN